MKNACCRRLPLLLGALLLAGVPALAQTIYIPSGTSGIGSSSNGNVGIGTTSPDAKLDVAGPAKFKTDNGYYGTRIGSNAGGDSYVWIGSRVGVPVIQGQNEAFASVLPLALQAEGGNVGIGTVSPVAKLHLVQSGGSLVEGAVEMDRYDGNGGYFIGRSAGGTLAAPTATGPTDALAVFQGAGYANGAFTIRRGDMIIASDEQWTATANGTSIRFRTTPLGTTATAEAMRIAASGNIGIGTANPIHKLSVNGTIRAKEVIVDTGWSDYVFERGYRLAPLAEVERHIAENGHLPGIPSAAEVAEHGVSMGEMQAKLLAKVEELTLHVIAQEKRQEAQGLEISSLRSENRRLREQLNRLSTADTP
jgi:hypothetical protein